MISIKLFLSTNSFPKEDCLAAESHEAKSLAIVVIPNDCPLLKDWIRQVKGVAQYKL